MQMANGEARLSGYVWSKREKGSVGKWEWWEIAQKNVSSSIGTETMEDERLHAKRDLVNLPKKFQIF